MIFILITMRSNSSQTPPPLGADRKGTLKSITHLITFTAGCRTSHDYVQRRKMKIKPTKLKVQRVPLMSPLVQICHSLTEVQRGPRVTEHNAVFQFVRRKKKMTLKLESVRFDPKDFMFFCVFNLFRAWAQPSSARQQECHVYILLSHHLRVNLCSKTTSFLHRKGVKKLPLIT